MGKDALVVDRNVLFGGQEFQGFLSFEDRDFIETIGGNHYYHPRGDDLENNKSLQQVIPYVWIVNSVEKKAFLYKRTVNLSKQDGEYREERYMNK